jgi:hypothetical protein
MIAERALSFQEQIGLAKRVPMSGDEAVQQLVRDAVSEG